MSIWEDPTLQVGGDYVKFENVGDSVQGELLSVGVHKWNDGSVSPQLIIRTEDGEKTVTAGQIRLKAALVEKKPEAGDLIKITLSDIEKRQGGKTLKHFDVQVKKATATADLLRDKLGATQVSAPF